MFDHQILASDTAYAAGSLLGALFLPILGAVLLIVGLVKRRRTGEVPESQARAKRFIVVGSVVLAVGLFMFFAGGLTSAK